MNTHTLLNRLMRGAHRWQGHRVVMDKDAAAMYGVSVQRLRRVVKNNIDRFPPDVLFILPSHYAFTEEGVLLLSSILNTPQAVQTSVDVIRELFGYRMN